MPLSTTLKHFLDNKGVRYEIIHHPHTRCSMETAQAAHIPGDQLAKSVILEDDGGYVMAVVPATHQVELSKLNKRLRRQLGLVSESEITSLFEDCEPGAVPPVGQAYGFDVVIDDCLTAYHDVYFEGGDHTAVVHLTGRNFKQLMESAQRGHISRRAA